MDGIPVYWLSSRVVTPCPYTLKTCGMRDSKSTDCGSSCNNTHHLGYGLWCSMAWLESILVYWLSCQTLSMHAQDIVTFFLYPHKVLVRPCDMILYLSSASTHCLLGDIGYSDLAWPAILLIASWLMGFTSTNCWDWVCQRWAVDT